MPTPAGVGGFSMAIIKLGPTVIGIRGTLGGITFSANKSGNYAKSWTRSTNPQTPKQSVVRATLATFGSSWRALSTAQRTLWNVYAALPAQDLVNSLGITYSISGFLWFVKINIQRSTVGLGQLSTAPLLVRPAAPNINLLQIRSIGGSNIQFPVAEWAPDFYAVIFLAMKTSVAALNFANLHKFTQSSLNPPGTILSIDTAVRSLFGDPIIGQRYESRIFTQDSSGQRSVATVNQTNTIA